MHDVVVVVVVVAVVAVAAVVVVVFVVVLVGEFSTTWWPFMDLPQTFRASTSRIFLLLAAAR
jgi:hypothetical protein